MKPTLYHLVLVVLWVAITDSYSLPNLLLGLVLGFVAIHLVRGQMRPPGPVVRPLRVASLGLLFLYELVLSAWRVLVLVLSPKMVLKPGILAFPLTVDHDAEITLLANLITLTPGTLSVDVSAGRRTLYVHALDCSDPDGVRRDIAAGFERKIMEAFR